MVYIGMLGFFYLSFYLLIPRFYFRKKYVQILLASVIFLVLMIAIPPFIFQAKHISTENAGMVFRRPPGPPFFIRAGHILMLSVATFLLALTLRINLRLQISEKEKSKAELLYLKAQINPHFLFNTLNGIYALAIQNSSKTADAIVKLSGMMRYVLNESQKEKVALLDEIAYIKDFIDLQRMRLADTVAVHLRFNGIMLGHEIAPLVLIPFIENAFKHGVNTEENSEIWVKISLEGDDFFMEVKNNNVHSSDTHFEKSGLGIANTKNRLNHIYPGRHNLKIQETDSLYVVQLKINLV